MNKDNRNRTGKRYTSWHGKRRSLRFESLEVRRMLAVDVAIYYVNGYTGCCVPNDLPGRLTAELDDAYNDGRIDSWQQYYTNWNSPDPRDTGGNPNVGTDSDFVRAMSEELSLYDPEDVVVWIGHSFGGDSILKAAEANKRTSKELDLLAVLDPVSAGGLRGSFPSVNENVRYFFNRFQTNAPFPFNFTADGKLNESGFRSVQADFGFPDEAEQSTNRESDGGVRTRSCNLLDPLAAPFCKVDDNGTPLNPFDDVVYRDDLQHSNYPTDDYIEQQLFEIIQGLIPQPPAASAGLDQSQDEGAIVTLDGSGSSDPNPGDIDTSTYAWQLIAGPTGKGAPQSLTGVNPSFTPGDNGTFEYRLTVTDPGGLDDSDVVTIVVNNVAPVVGPISGPVASVRGFTVDFSTTFHDPGFLDQHSIEWSFGDGQGSARSSLSSNPPLAISHLYTHAGSYTVAATIRDDDGGAGSSSRQIEIRAAGLITDPEDPSKLALAVGGTLGDDVIVLLPGPAAGEIEVIINGKSEGVFAPTGQILVAGQSGDDEITISNDIARKATVDAGTGNDTVHGGSGNDTLIGNDGHDVFVGGPGVDTLDGGPGIDTVLVRGTPGNDTITAAQTSSGSLSVNVNGVSDTDSVAGIEVLAIESLEGADAIAISQADAIAGSLAFRVDGGPGVTDRLVVRDEGLGDLVIQRLGPDDVSGMITVGGLAPVDYVNIERTDISPINSVAGTSGVDGLGRVLVLPFDRLEPNDLRTIATPLGDGPTFIGGLTIDPAGQELPAPFDDVPADEDWFEFTPAKTGIYRFEARFDEIGTLPNGRPGLPNNGNLDVRVYTSAGVLIDSSAASTSNEFVDISVAAGKRYYARVSGVGQAVNIYDLAVTERDLTGPQVTSVTITGAPNFNLFDVKPSLSGPTPGVLGLTIGITDAIARALGDLYPALANGVVTPGIIQLIGDHTGIVAIKSVTLVNDPPVAGQVATAKLFITFYDYLPDDRYTLVLSDAIVDPADNALDGDSNAATPQVIVLPSGDLIAGGNFIARFTVDSRPEVGTISEGLVYVDINGNLQWDPTGDDSDATNRDLVFQFGQITDAHFAGNFAIVGAAKASGFDKLGAYGKLGSSYSFVLDTNDDGVADFSSPMPSSYQVNGIPVAGNFNAAHPGDEIGLFDGSYWYMDANGNNRIDVGERWASNFNGLPLVGDFNGDGADDLAAFNNATNVFVFDTNRDGVSDYTWNVQDAVKRFTGLSGFTDRPVVGDLNLDGIDDIGLWVTDRSGTLPRNSGEFFFWVSDNRATNPANVFSAYSPAPLGNDLYAEFGDDYALPIFGNFDPPVSNAPSSENPLHNDANPFDTNGDGFVSAIDALLVINVLNLNLNLPANDPVRAFATVGFQTVDVSGDRAVSALDALLVINALNSRSIGGPDGEQSATTSRASSVDAAFAELDNWELDAFKRKRLSTAGA